MGNWLRTSILIFCLAQFYETGKSAVAYRIPPESLQTRGNGTFMMPGSEWRRDGWTCKAKEFMMKVGDENCELRYVKNNYCLGYCNSLSIPRYSGLLKLCNSCLPKTKVRETVAVNCIRNGRRVVVFKEVGIIKDCKCATVEC